MTEIAAEGPVYGPPVPLRLDDVTFFNVRHEVEQAWRGDVLIGELDLKDETLEWQARKFVGGTNDDWRHMRCRAEARAFLVSRIRL